MKTAVIIDGQMRTFARCLKNQKWMVLRKLDDPGFFVSCADDAQAESANLLHKEFPGALVEIERVEQPVLLEPPASLMDHAPYAVTPTRTPGVSAAQGLLRQLWSQSRAWKFAQSKGAGEAQTYVRMRPDLHFHEFDEPFWPALNQALVPYWGNYGGVNDRFAILGREAAVAWFNAYDDLPEMFANGCPLHPESIRACALERSGIVVNRELRAEFSFRRMNGALEGMVILPGEMIFNR